MTESRDKSQGGPPRRSTATGLSTRVLLLTITFVMIAEVAIYIPSIANFRNNWLRDRLSAAYTAALVLEAAPEEAIPEQLKSDLLASVGAKSIVLKTQDTRTLLAVTDMPPSASERFDLRTATPWQSVSGAFATLLARENRTLVAIGNAPRGAEFIEIALSDRPLREAMWRYSFNILLLSIIISAIVAMLAVLALHLLVLRPVQRLTSSLIEFRDNPKIPAASSSRRARDTKWDWRRKRLPKRRMRCCRNCARRNASPRSASPWRRSTTTCATCCRPRNCCPTASRIRPTRWAEPWRRS